MVFPRIRLKINLSMAATAFVFVSGMWVFDTEVLNHDWRTALNDLPLVAFIVGLIIAVAVVVNYLSLRPLVACLKKIETGGQPGPPERQRALVAMVRLPAVIIVLNVLGFFLGPLGRLVPKALIDGQSLLLPMNASIEAAHAGSFGRGFAVVADEVRKLAEESAQSAVQIGDEIQAMASSVVEGAALSRLTGEALGKISSDINKSTVLMTSIAQAMEEQAAGARGILDSVGSIVQTTQGIQSRTADQFARSNRIRENMDLLVGAATDIRAAAASQGANVNVLKDAIDNPGKVMAKNQEVVRELNRAVGKLKL